MKAVRLDPADVHAYLARDWGAFERSNRAHWSAVRDRGGARALLRIAGVLRAHAQTIDPAWPTKDDREADLQTHRRVAAFLARVPDPRPPARSPRGSGRRRALGVRRAR